MIRSTVRSLLLTLTLVLLPLEVLADGSRQFLAVFRGTANPMPTSDLCILTNAEIGSGLATAMGAVTWKSNEVVDFCSDPNGAVVDGKGVLKAARGDEVFIVYQTLATTNPEFTEIRASGTYEITGGTGRFSNASGTGLIAAQGSLLPPFEFVGVLIGKIFPAGSDP